MASTLIFIATLLYIEETCSSKVKSESVWIPSNFSVEVQKKVAFYRVDFHAIVVKPCEEFTGSYLEFRNNCINVGRTSVWSCIVSIVFNVRVFTFVEHISWVYIKSNEPKVESSRSPYSSFNLLLNKPFYSGATGTIMEIAEYKLKR